jgi:hypothetical protein
MRQFNTSAEKRIAKFRKEWTWITRLGATFYIFGLGAIVLVVSCLFYAGLTYISGGERGSHLLLAIKNRLPFLMAYSYIFAFSRYWSVKQRIRRIGPEQTTT